MIAIQIAGGGFSDRWISYCQNNGIEFKIVDVYKNDIIKQLQDCDALMWQFYQCSPKDYLMAKQLIYAIQSIDIKVFPDFWSNWHFDDKVGQKYLLEAIKAPIPKTWVFYDEKEAIHWAIHTSFPKVFKLRGGAGSQNVKLIKTRKHAVRLIKKAFRRGFSNYDPFGSLKERWRLYKLKRTNYVDLLEGLLRFVIYPRFSSLRGKEKGYIYFQEFVNNNTYDIRVVVIRNKAFAIKRLVRDNDFRASGSGNIEYEKNLFEENTIRLSFDIANKLKSQSIAFDYVHDNFKPLLIEISYGFTPEGYDLCQGYWDSQLNWFKGKFDPYGWMVEDILKDIMQKRNESITLS